MGPSCLTLSDHQHQLLPRLSSPHPPTSFLCLDHGFERESQMYTLHAEFFKSILGVQRKTQNNACKAELRPYPIVIQIESYTQKIVPLASLSSDSVQHTTTTSKKLNLVIKKTIRHIGKNPRKITIFWLATCPYQRIHCCRIPDHCD